MDLSKKASTSKYVESPEKDEKEEDEKELKRRIKEEREAYKRSLNYSEKEKLRNLNKIRLRRSPRFGNRSPTLAAIYTLNALYNTDLTPDDIVECVRVPSWTGQNDTDVLITFVNEDRRNHVYHRRTKENRGYVMICDELGEERLAIWQKLVAKYGINNVYTHCGGVMLDLDGKKHRFLAMRELKKFEDAQKDTEVD